MIDVPALVVRDGILVVAWLTAVYLVFTLLNLSQLGRLNGAQDDMPSVFEPPVLELTRAAASSDAGKSSLNARNATRTLRVSPRHEVAVSLAFQGFDVAGIARRCDISVAEAKLVATLVQSYRSLETTVEKPYGRPPGTRVAA